MTHAERLQLIAAWAIAAISFLFALEAFLSVRDTLKAIARLRREIEETRDHDHDAD